MCRAKQIVIDCIVKLNRLDRKEQIRSKINQIDDLNRLKLSY